MGAAGLGVDTANRYAEAWYWIRAYLQRRGIATAAVRQLLDYAFSQPDLLRAEFMISTNYTASVRVAKNVCAVRESTMRAKIYLNGKSHDAWYYVVLSHARNHNLS